MPSEGGMILKRLMTVTNDYYVKRTTVTTKGLHVILDVELYPFEPQPVIRIIEKLEEKQFVQGTSWKSNGRGLAPVFRGAVCGECVGVVSVRRLGLSVH